MITSEQKKEIIRLFKDGLNPNKLAKMYGICRTTVLYHIRNSDKPIVQRKSKGGRKGERISKNEKNYALTKAREIRLKVVKTYSDYLSGIIELERDDEGNVIGKRLLEKI